METLVEEFKTKLWFKTSGNKIQKPNAIRQLSNNIRAVLTKKYDFDTGYKVQSLKIYPIIILHDPCFECGGFNNLINYWFEEELNKLKAEGFNTSKIQRIAILNIDTIILNADYFRADPTRLSSVVEKFIKSTTINPKRKYSDRDNFAETFIPFSIFLNNHISKSGPQHNDALYNQILKEFGTPENLTPTPLP